MHYNHSQKEKPLQNHPKKTSENTKTLGEAPSISHPCKPTKIKKKKQVLLKKLSKMLYTGDACEGKNKCR